MNPADEPPMMETAATGGRGAPIPRPTPFVWPPRPMTELDSASASDRVVAVARRPLSAWEQFEQEWLGVTTPPLHRRLSDAGAVPDPINAFCWRCARTVGPFETDAKGCSQCRGTRQPWNRFVRLAEYQAPWSLIVQDAKFSRWPRLSVDAGRLLGRQVALAEPELGDRPTVVVPVPTNFWRRLGRGTDHSLNLARGVAKELQLPLRLMLRRQRRPEQARLSKTDRESNLRGAFSRSRVDAILGSLGWSRGARWPDGAESARLIVVDDISTTGATMSETCRALRLACKSLNIKDLQIIAAVVCRTEQGR